MTIPQSGTQLSQEHLVTAFFQQSAGDWRSERRYYTLKEGETQEVVSFLTVRFLAPDSDALLALAALHQLSPDHPLVCGAETTWESHYAGPVPKQVKGSTIFGVRGTTLYRDRGFATTKPVQATFYLTEPTTLRLRTEYGGSLFEEEIKLIGTNYRTRQTIISRAGEEQMIGQYLERRLPN